jgi:hypothetical protein
VPPEDTRERELRIDTPWLGSSRGQLSDWFTQRWVQLTGRRVSLGDHPWLDGPTGDPDVIGSDFFDRLAAARGLTVDEQTLPRGLLDDFSALSGPGCSVDRIAPQVVRFYERTSEYKLDVWSQWCGAYRPFGSVLAVLFSRRLQQLNVPLAPLDTSLGISNRVLKLRKPDGQAILTAWVRELLGSRNTLYAGSYGVCAVPGEPGACMRVVFPLPNGSAIVVMRPESHPDGSLTVSSFGSAFGSAGFYFYVSGGSGHGWARYVPTLKESIRVFLGPDQTLRADHVLHIFGAAFLKLHYRMAPLSDDLAGGSR